MTNEDLQKLAQRHPARNRHLLGAAQLSCPHGQQAAPPTLERKSSREKSALSRVVGRRAPVLRITIIAFQDRITDRDNFIGGAKFLRDAVANYFGMDDAEGAGIEWRYEQVKTKLAPHTAVLVRLLTIPGIISST